MFEDEPSFDSATLAAMQAAIDPAMAELALEFAELAAPQLPLAEWADWPPLARGALLARLFNHLLAAGNERSLTVFNQSVSTPWLRGVTGVLLSQADSPFLVDTLRLSANRADQSVTLIESVLLSVARGPNGEIRELRPALEGLTGADFRREALVYLEVAALGEPELSPLQHALEQALVQLDRVVVDYAPALAALAELRQSLTGQSEAQAFLSWLEAGHFTFLGYREWDLVAGELLPAARAPLGLLALEDAQPHTPSAGAMRFYDSPELIAFSKAETRAPVHRSVYPDYIVVKRCNAAGKVVGEARILGIFTYAVHTLSPWQIPLVRQKLGVLRGRAGHLPGSHDDKTLLRVMEMFPRDELFQADPNTLFNALMGVAAINERRVVRLFLRLSNFGKFAFAQVYVPRDLYNTSIRQAIEALLADALRAVGFETTTTFSESLLARAQVTLKLSPESPIQVDTLALERAIAELTRGFEERLAENIFKRFGPTAAALATRYRKAFSAGYRERYSAAVAAEDIELVERLEAGPDAIAVKLYTAAEEAEGRLRFKIVRRHSPVELSTAIPLLENLGVRVLAETPHSLNLTDGGVWLHDFELLWNSAQVLDVVAVSRLFEEAFAAVWAGRAESDTFNRLVLGARLAWREVVLLRALAGYLKQTGFTFSGDYIATTLAANVDITRNLVALFKAQFSPRFNENATKAEERMTRLSGKLAEGLAAVVSLDEDRVFRRYLALIQAMTRTNYFQTDASGAVKNYISFKFEPRRLSGLPEPRPAFEVYVYSPRMEGVHLRGGRVARGGIRWSDRLQDYRTEVLGLVKAQQVKNAVIVPTGAKGGFVCKQAGQLSSREAVFEEAVACYRQLIRGLLDITDNYRDGAEVRPAQVVCRDEFDPYLVVAADKGTATFSDFANELSLEYGHWLGDAFASGGSRGYDHKKMGITARGAFVSVARHFRELGLDVMREPFSVIGIGDMAGDVFGNGMLLSPCIKLVGAFNHQHIFLDPNPNPATSFNERRRLFELSRSAWSDYNTQLISPGGGVFNRSAKTIALSPEVQSLLGLDTDNLAPPDLISAMLRAPVDLIWNGGIGTYVKAGDEGHAQVGDKTNDAVRVNGGELRCRVFGEGGNLGMTQRGRIEYALTGGACFTDFIDNSGGVDCSDHEVNLKILLDALVASGSLSVEARNQWLEQMTDAVAELVLEDNRRQTFNLSICARNGQRETRELSALKDALTRVGRLDPALEFLPDAATLAARGHIFTKPELCVLLCYAKVQLKEALLADQAAAEPALAHYLFEAFPLAVAERLGETAHIHRLRPEIVATQVTNDFIDTLGIASYHRLASATGRSARELASSFAAASSVFRLRPFRRWHKTRAGAADTDLQFELWNNMARRLRWAVRWMAGEADLARAEPQAVAYYSDALAQLQAHMGDLLKGASRERLNARLASLAEAEVPLEWQAVLAVPSSLFSGLGAVAAARATGVEPLVAGELFFGLFEALKLDELASLLTEVPVENEWQAVAREGFIEDIDRKLRALTCRLLTRGDSPQAWLERHEVVVTRWQALVAELESSASTDFAAFAVALNKLDSLTLAE